jgi:DUF917 family protein
MRLLGNQEIEDIAIGSAVLGTGGGGDPYLGKLAALQAIKAHGPLQLATVDDLPDDTLVVCPFGIGAPVPFLERITLVDELEHSYNVMCKYFGRKPGALMSIEIGGMNSVIPFALGARLGLPVIDADGMGRAYPEIQMVTFTLHGHLAAPLTVADEHGNVILVDTISNTWAEWLARPAAAVMGAIAGGCGFPLTVADIRSGGVLGTVSFAERIGSAIRHAQRAHTSPVEAVLKETNGFQIFQGRVVDVQRRVDAGWTKGETTISGVDDYEGREMTIRFQNEHLVAIEDGEVVVSVPDLIAILDTERGEPVTTENIRYGFRVTIVGLPADKQWRTPEGIELGGPRHFGYDIDFVPVEERYGAAAVS